MNGNAVIPPPEGRRAERLIGHYTAGRPGPTLVIVAGVHGNEPAGLEAQRRVLDSLQQRGAPLHGRVEALAGNLGALARGERFSQRDLNRQWLSGQVSALLSRDPSADDEEDREQRELLREFDRCVGQSAGPVVFLDLHTSSADGPPFCCMGDTMPNRHIAFSLPIPVILGLEETIDGAVMEYFNERGLAAIAIEGGRHQHPATVDALEAAIWLVMVAIGAIAADDVPDLEQHRERLGAASRGAPHVVEVRDHHRIRPQDRFRMRPGYQSFDPVSKGDVLADDARGEVVAIENGMVLLPLYQGKGEDGFFLVREVAVFWLVLARWLRRLRLDAIVPVLPGVRRHPDRVDALRVDPRIARWLVRELFHLLGYRRCRPEGRWLVFSRRQVTASTAQLPWRPR